MQQPLCLRTRLRRPQDAARISLTCVLSSATSDFKCREMLLQSLHSLCRDGYRSGRIAQPVTRCCASCWQDICHCNHQYTIIAGATCRMLFPIAPYISSPLAHRYNSVHCTSRSCQKRWRHFSAIAQNMTNIAPVMRFSVLHQIGVPIRKRLSPAHPVFPPGGVTPPGPEKYGTFAARWLYSMRNVMYWLGM